VSESVASVLVAIATWYSIAGLAFAVPFLWRGVGRIDPAARNGTWGFRVLIVPGVVIFWPLLAARWASGSVHPPREQTANRRAAKRRTA
jgi:hypothetical protein